MVASLNGIIFDQVYGDNSGGAEFDTDKDGTATQEDEFVSVQNTTGAPVDLSGWQIWSDSSGANAPDSPQDGLYHTFPSGSVLGPGETLFIINEYSGTPPPNFQEASEGGVESGAGDASTNFLSEGASGPEFGEAVALVNPSTGEYIVLHFSGDETTDFTGQTGFPGTTIVATSNAATDSGVEDMNAGSSYQYNSTTDRYEYQAVAVTCFAAGTRIAVPGGECAVDALEPGDMVVTLDHGPQAIRAVLKRHIDFNAGANDCHKPIEFKANALGRGLPKRRLVVSPQHRMLVRARGMEEVLVPAKSLTTQPGVRRMSGRRTVLYCHLVFDRHEIISAEGCWTESFFPGAYALSRADGRTKAELFAIFPDLASGRPPRQVRPCVKVSDARKLAPHFASV